MRTKTVRILNIVAGILLIAAGIYCLCNEDVAVLSAGLMLGIFMLAAGIAEIVVFAGTSGMLIGSGWLLLDGVLTVIMSLFLLFNQWFTLLSLPFLFTVWLMFSGLSRFVSAFDLHAPGVAAWAGGRAKAINKINVPPSLNRIIDSKKTVFFTASGALSRRHRDLQESPQQKAPSGYRRRSPVHPFRRLFWTWHRWRCRGR